MDRIFEVVYSHWKDTDRLLTVQGDLPDNMNSSESDLIFVERHDGQIVDIRKESVISTTQLKPKP